jgi:flagellar hook assembly protein FlgD
VFQTVVGTGISSYWHSFQGSGEPSGIGTTVSLRGSGYYNWSMDSGIPQNPKPIINSFTVSTNPFSPNSDGAKDTTTLAASFNVLVNWNIQAKNKYGTVIRTWKGTGLNLALVWDGKNSTGYRVADGTYNLTLSGKDQVGNNLVSKTIQVTVDTKPPSVTNAYVCPTTFSPRYAQTTKIFYTLSESSYVTIKIYNSTGSLIRTIISSNLQSSGAHAFTWNGKTSSGTTVKTGTYTFKLYVSDKAGNKASPYPILKTVKVT